MFKRLTLLCLALCTLSLSARKLYDIRPFELRLKNSSEIVRRGVRIIRFSLDTYENYSKALKTKAKKAGVPTTLYMPKIEHIDYYVLQSINRHYPSRTIALDGYTIEWTKVADRYVTNVSLSADSVTPLEQEDDLFAEDGAHEKVFIAEGSITGAEGVRTFTQESSPGQIVPFSSVGQINALGFMALLNKFADVRQTMRAPAGQTMHPYCRAGELITWHPVQGEAIQYTFPDFFDQTVVSTKEKCAAAEHFFDSLLYWHTAAKHPSKCNTQDNGPDGIYLTSEENPGMIWGEVKNKNPKNGKSNRKSTPQPKTLMNEDIWGPNKNGVMQFIVKYGGMKDSPYPAVKQTQAMVRDYIINDKLFAFIECLVLPSGKNRRFVCNIDAPPKSEWGREALKTAIVLFENPIVKPVTPLKLEPPFSPKNQPILDEAELLVSPGNKEAKLAFMQSLMGTFSLNPEVLTPKDKQKYKLYAAELIKLRDQFYKDFNHLFMLNQSNNELVGIPNGDNLNLEDEGIPSASNGTHKKLPPKI